jgi:hypothetical protein
MAKKSITFLIALFLAAFASLAAFGATMSAAGFNSALLDCRAAAAPDIWKSKDIPAGCSFLNSRIFIAGEKGKSYSIPLQYIPQAYLDDIRSARGKAAVDRAKKNFSEKLLCLEKEIPFLICEKGCAADVAFGPFANRLKTILKSKEYDEPKQIDWKKHLPKWLRDWLEKIGDRFAVSDRIEKIPRAFKFILKALALIGATVIAGMIILNIVSTLRASKAPPAEEAAESGTDDVAAISEPEGLLRAARGFAESGKFRHAARCVYISFVRLVEEAGLVTYLEVKTNREYLAELEAKKPVSDNVRRMNGIYEDLWYGMQPCTPETYEDFCGLYDVCLKEVL